MKKLPASGDTEQRLRAIVRETIQEVLRPSEPQLDILIDRVTHRIVDFELPRVIHSALQNELILLTPEIENNIWNRLLSIPEIREYLSPHVSLALAMIIPEGEPNPGREILKRRIAKAKEIFICDPYFFHDPYKDEEKYFEGIISTLPLNYLEKLLIFCKQPRSSTIIRNFRKTIDPKVKLEVYEVNDIHDRIWIKDLAKGVVVGTSFGGIGNKLTFILNLPKRDLQDLLQLLDGIRSRKKPII